MALQGLGSLWVSRSAVLRASEITDDCGACGVFRGALSESMLLAIAVGRECLTMAGIAVPVPTSVRAGVVHGTSRGDSYAEERSSALLAQGRRRMSPSEFGRLVHNSSAGAASLALGLRGPQIVCFSGDPLVAAAHQIMAGRCQLMLVFATLGSDDSAQTSTFQAFGILVTDGRVGSGARYPLVEVCASKTVVSPESALLSCCLRTRSLAG